MQDYDNLHNLLKIHFIVDQIQNQNPHHEENPFASNCSHSMGKKVKIGVPATAIEKENH